MKAYLKAKKYLELYIVADNTLVSIETIFFLLMVRFFSTQVLLMSLGSYYNYSAILCFTTDFG